MVFYPRYVEMVHETVEEWFADAVGVSFAEWHGPRQASVPVVKLSFEFIAPSKLGDELRLELIVEHIGTSSLQLAVTAFCGDQLRFKSQQTLVQISMDDHRSRPWELDIRARFRCWCDQAGEVSA
jgi:4-hydroxybenzoyl-CoA thioesterase